jgi:tRNA(Ser,Leu) C12 N-acetylase TAN1
LKDWNVVVTAAQGGRRERFLLQELRQFGDFHPTGFRSVYLGWVEDVPRFLEELREAMEMIPEALAGLGQVVPIEETRSFEPGELREALREAVLPYAERIGPRPFIVRVKRRGYKGLVSSPELERELSGLLHADLEARGFEPRIDFADPGAVLVVELFPNRFGLSLIGREMKARYPFIKVK